MNHESSEYLGYILDIWQYTILNISNTDVKLKAGYVPNIEDTVLDIRIQWCLTIGCKLSLKL